MTQKFTRALGLVLSGALAAGGAALGSAGTAHAAGPKKLTKVSAVAAPKSVALPADGATADVTVKVTFNGAAVDTTDTNGDGYTVAYAAVTAKAQPTVTSATRIRKPVKPVLVASAPSSMLAPGSAATFVVQVAATTTPGKYTLNVPITQTITKVSTGKASRTTKTGKATFKVLANTEFSAANSTLVSMQGYLGRKFSVHITAPAYTYGAKVTVYFAKNGSKKFKAIGSGKVNSKGVAKFKTKSGKIRSTGAVYFKVGKLDWSAGYKVGYWPLGLA